MIKDAEAKAIADHEGDPMAKLNKLTQEQYYTELTTKWKAEKFYLHELEVQVARLKFMAKMKTMNETQVLMDKQGRPDEQLGVETGFMPYAKTIE